MDAVFLKQEETYMSGVLNFFKVKELELNHQLQKLKDKNNSLHDQDEQIVQLKKTILLIRQELFQADQNQVKQNKKMKEIKDVYQNVLKDK